MIAVGLCECGCGERTKLAPKTLAARGWKKGQPLRFVHNHHRRGYVGPTTTYAVEDRGFETPCHIWQGYIRPTGYGGQWSRTRKQPCSAHVVAWEEAHGPVPPGRELDHLCRQRACVNLDHLELVTHAENIRRGISVKRTRAQVSEVKRLRGKLPQQAIADLLGIPKHAVADIHAGRKWRGVGRLADE